MLKRLKQYIDYKGITVSGFERSIQISNASFGKSLQKGGTIGADKLEKILKIYPDINLYWLITGKGEMIIENKNLVNEPEVEYKIDEPKISIECLKKREQDLLLNIQAQQKTIVMQDKLIKCLESEIENLKLKASQNGTSKPIKIQP